MTRPGVAPRGDGEGGSGRARRSTGPVRAHPIGAWSLLGAVLAGFAALLIATSDRFDWQLPLVQMPALWLSLGMVAAGLVYLGVLPLVHLAVVQSAAVQRHILVLMLAVGLGLRLALFWTEPALEDDYNRYLWEGALTAHGISPYEVSPAVAQTAPPGTALAKLAEEAGPVLARVNHPHLRSNYPPVAQAAFAVAYLISPWNLTAWRLVSLTCDAAILALLLALLRHAGRPLIWAALYWWNPLAIKELINSAHMDGLVVALALGALLLAARSRHAWATFVLGLAMGAKLWPVLLAPLILRPLWPRLRPLAGGIGALAVMGTAWFLPAWSGGLDDGSLYVAYARHWATNSALYPALAGGAEGVLRVLGGRADAASLAVRAAIACLLGGLAVWQSRRALDGTSDVMRRAGVITVALIVLSPAQFPWYMVWALPFAAFQPTWGLLAATVTLPLYYAAFHFIARDAYPTFAGVIVWIIWVPVWALLAAEAWCAYRGPARRAGPGRAA